MTSVVIDTDSIGSSKSNYHAMTAPESVVLFNSIDNIINNIYLYLHEKQVFLLGNRIQHFGVFSRQCKWLLTKNMFPSIQHQQAQSDVFLWD